MFLSFVIGIFLASCNSEKTIQTDSLEAFQSSIETIRASLPFEKRNLFDTALQFAADDQDIDINTFADLFHNSNLKKTYSNNEQSVELTPSRQAPDIVLPQSLQWFNNKSAEQILAYAAPRVITKTKSQLDDMMDRINQLEVDIQEQNRIIETLSNNLPKLNDNKNNLYAVFNKTQKKLELRKNKKPIKIVPATMVSNDIATLSIDNNSDFFINRLDYEVDIKSTGTYLEGNMPNGDSCNFAQGNIKNIRSGEQRVISLKIFNSLCGETPSMRTRWQKTIADNNFDIQFFSRVVSNEQISNRDAIVTLTNLSEKIALQLEEATNNYDQLRTQVRDVSFTITRFESTQKKLKNNVLLAKNTISKWQPLNNTRI